MSKKNKLYIMLVAAAILSYILLGFYIIGQSADTLSVGYKEKLKSDALNVAQLASKYYKITNAEVEELKQISFEELLQHPVNQRFHALFDKLQLSDDLKYAYVMLFLPEDEIEYTVTQEHSEFYGLPVGEPLDLLWLLDCILNEKEAQLALDDPNYYTDIRRYSKMNDIVKMAYLNQEKAAISTNGEYGMAFTGLVPLYSVEGDFVGLFGIDIYYEKFLNYIEDIRNYLTSFFLYPTIILGILFMYIYIRNIKKIRRTANIDGLTGIYNRGYFDKIYQQYFKASKKEKHVTLFLIDIDYFKVFNDSYGHLMGDKALIQVASCIDKASEKNGAKAFRYGGEEFVVILDSIEKEKAIALAQDIQQEVAKAQIVHEYSGVNKFITVSQGIYQFTIDKYSVYDSMYLDYADKMLYKAKKNGRNCYMIDEISR